MISVCMATYNGGRFIKEQIDSILNQTYQDFVIYISDDKSTDKTRSIICDYVRNFSKKIFFLEKDEASGSSCKNFLSLIERVESDVYFFCDQDDVWDKDKIEKTIKFFEKQTDKSIPLLVHSDLRVVDAYLQTISLSFMEMTHKAKCLTWKEYLVENNNVVGCTSAINKELANLYKNNYKNINVDKLFMHDSFFAQLASLSGKIEFIDEALVDYRQHGSNVVGATKKLCLFKSMIRKIYSFKQNKLLFDQRKENLKEVLKCFNNVKDEKLVIVEEFSKLNSKLKIMRIFFLIKNKIKRKSFFENFYVWLSI